MKLNETNNKQGGTLPNVEPHGEGRAVQLWFEGCDRSDPAAVSAINDWVNNRLINNPAWIDYVSKWDNEVGDVGWLSLQDDDDVDMDAGVIRALRTFAFSSGFGVSENPAGGLRMEIGPIFPTFEEREKGNVRSNAIQLVYPDVDVDRTSLDDWVRTALLRDKYWLPAYSVWVPGNANVGWLECTATGGSEYLSDTLLRRYAMLNRMRYTTNAWGERMLVVFEFKRQFAGYEAWHSR